MLGDDLSHGQFCRRVILVVWIIVGLSWLFSVVVGGDSINMSMGFTIAGVIVTAIIGRDALERGEG